MVEMAQCTARLSPEDAARVQVCGDITEGVAIGVMCAICIERSCFKQESTPNSPKHVPRLECEPAWRAPHTPGPMPNDFALVMVLADQLRVLPFTTIT